MTDIIFAENKITLDDLLKMPGDSRVEIINGEIKEMAAAGVQHGFIALPAWAQKQAKAKIE
jgi:hypothetical protein